MTSYSDKLRLRIFFKNGLTKTVDIDCATDIDASKYWDEIRPELLKIDSIHTNGFWFKMDEVVFIERI